jgi:type IV pilus assembly protein PilV
MDRTISRRGSPQGGFMLLEVLVAMLVFAFGVLSLVGLQAASMKQSSAAKYRTDASLLANELIGRMWTSQRTFATLDADFSTDGPAYETWKQSVEAALPGAAANPPTVDVESVPAGTPGGPPGSRVTIVIQWKPPNEPADEPVRSLTVVTQFASR